jgi:hypothetical protein
VSNTHAAELLIQYCYTQTYTVTTLSPPATPLEQAKDIFTQHYLVWLLAAQYDVHEMSNFTINQLSEHVSPSVCATSTILSDSDCIRFI